ncbi:unnamed protein product, partial [Owenia fusiformis]
YNFDSSVEPVRRPGFGGKFGDFMPGDDSHRGQGRSDGSRGRGDSLRPTHGDSPRNRGEPSRNYDGHRNRGDAYHDHRGDERSPRSFGDGPRGRGEGSRGRGDSSRGRGDGSRGRGLIRGARGASARGMRGGRLRPRGGTAGTGRTRAHSGGSTGSDEARHIQDDENTLVIRIDNEAGSARRKTNERGKPRSPRSPTSKQGKPRGKEGKDKKLRESRPLRSSTPTKEKHSEVTEGDSKPTNPDNVEEENAIKIDSDIQISINRASGEREIRSTSKDKEDVEEPRAGSSDSQSRGSSSEKDLREGSNEIRASNSGKESRGGSSEKENSDYGDQYEEYEEEHQDEWEDCDDDFYEEEVESLEEEPRQVLQLDVHTEDDSSMLPPTTPVMKTPTGVVHILDWAQAVEDNSFDASGSSVEASPREQRTPGDSPRNINKTEEIPLEIKNETPIESPKEQTSQNAGANESKVKIEENGKQNEVSEQNEQNKGKVEDLIAKNDISSIVSDKSPKIDSSETTSDNIDSSVVLTNTDISESANIDTPPIVQNTNLASCDLDKKIDICETSDGASQPIDDKIEISEKVVLNDATLERLSKPKENALDTLVKPVELIPETALTNDISPAAEIETNDDSSKPKDQSSEVESESQSCNVPNSNTLKQVPEPSSEVNSESPTTASESEIDNNKSETSNVKVESVDTKDELNESEVNSAEMKIEPVPSVIQVIPPVDEGKVSDSCDKAIDKTDTATIPDCAPSSDVNIHLNDDIDKLKDIDSCNVTLDKFDNISDSAAPDCTSANDVNATPNTDISIDMCDDQSVPNIDVVNISPVVSTETNISIDTCDDQSVPNIDTPVVTADSSEKAKPTIAVVNEDPTDNTETTENTSS